MLIRLIVMPGFVKQMLTPMYQSLSWMKRMTMRLKLKRNLKMYVFKLINR